MYSKVFYSNDQLAEIEPAIIETGLSSGIPQIQLLGDISSKYIRNSQKFYYVFSNSGRKLPNKKVRVLVTSNNDIKATDGLDLAVFTSVYLSMNDVETKEEHICLGKISLDGSITGYKNIVTAIMNATEWSLHNREKKVLFIPDIQLPNWLPDDLNILKVKHISSIYKYFEGRSDLKTRTDHPMVNNRQLQLKPVVILSKLLHKPIIILTDSPQTLDNISTDNHKKLKLQQKSSLETSDPYLDLLNNLRELNEDRDEDYIEIIEKCYRYSFFKPEILSIDLRNRKSYLDQHLKLFSILQNNHWILTTYHCPCGYKNSDISSCTCTSKEYQRHRDIINSLYRSFDPIVINESDISEINREIEEQIKLESIQVNIEHLPFYKQILQVTNNMNEKRARSLALLLKQIY